MLAARALNRALLARQGLLERSSVPAVEMVARLAGMQAQVPENPYLALWSRLRDFSPDELSEAIAGRALVRAQLMRATIHLVTARDCLALQPLVAPVLARTFMGAAQFRRALEAAGAELSPIIEAGVAALCEDEPLSRAELAERLAPRWPDADASSLAQAVTFHTPLVQVPPRGLWGRSGQPQWARTSAWLDGRAGAAPASLDEMVLRYLAAFGPATAADVRTWSGLGGMREVLERLRPRLRAFRDERGRELFDVPDAPLPDPSTPAPPRFLPLYDNVLLSHADRSRIRDAGAPPMPTPQGRWNGTLLVDGFHRANWRLAGGLVTIEGFESRNGDPAGTRDAIAAEAAQLTAFIDPDAGGECTFAS